MGTSLPNTMRCSIVGSVLLLFSVQFISCIPDAVDSSDKLIFAHILWRHGDRNIISTYPNDPWADESYWPGGLGQLTNIGRQQHNELGLYLRKRYYNLLPANGTYHRDNIYVRSTDVDRTLMSCAHNLAAFFPPVDQQVWNQSLLWQAIPIHTLPENMDHILAMKRPCPRYDQAYKDYLASDEVQAIFKSNETLIKYLESHSGKEITSICQVKTIYQALWVENLKEFKLPNWTETVFPGGDFEKLAQFCFKTYANTQLLGRLKAGSLVKEIFERFTTKAKGTLTPNRSLWIYSAHDTTIANLLNTLGLFEKPHIPAYTSCVFLELHETNGNFHVEIFYKQNRGEDEKPLEPLNFPDCGTKCPLNRLYEIYKDVIPSDDYEAECRIPDTSKNSNAAIQTDLKSSSQNLVQPIWITIGLIILAVMFR